MTEEEKQMAEEASQPPSRRWTHGPKYLFDLGKEATGGTTPYEMKDSRDTWYSKHRVAQENAGAQHTGGYLLSSSAYGDNLKARLVCWLAHPPTTLHAACRTCLQTRAPTN